MTTGSQIIDQETVNEIERLAKEEVLEDAIKALNKAFDLDGAAIGTLFSALISCEDRLRQHDKMMVRSDAYGNAISVLGILNAVIGTPQSKIAAVYNMQGDLQGFCRVDEKSKPLSLVFESPGNGFQSLPKGMISLD